MNLTTNAIFILAAVAMGIWMYRDSGFRKREFIFVALFMVTVVATPWGSDGVGMIQDVIRNLVSTAGSAINTAAS